MSFNWDDPPTPYGEFVGKCQRGATRYEMARLLNPRQWKELWRRNMAGENFDAMIDDIAANPNKEWTYEPD